MFILIHYYIILLKRNLLFKPDKLELILYIYIINLSIEAVLAKNNSNLPIIFTRKTCLGYIAEIPYNSCYFISSELAHLVFRSLKKVC